MPQPLVTVLMPVYNTEKYVAESIESVLNQTFGDFEFLIIDDGSTDKSLEVIKSYDDKRIRVVKNEENIKLIATLNKGIDLSEGKYICRIDADDINVLNRLEKQFNIMESHPEYAACSSWIENFYDDGRENFIVKYEELHNSIRIKTLYQNHFCHPSSFIRKDFINKNNARFDKRFIHSEDYFFFVKLSEIGTLYNIQEVLVKVRKHGTNVSVLNSQIQNKNSILVIAYQLNKIGINTENINYDLYFRFFYATFDLSKEEIEIAEKLALEMINENLKSQYLPQKELVDFICFKWYHLCVNSTRYGLWIYNKFNTSPLSSYYNLNAYRKFRFIIKSSIKFNRY